MCTSESQRGPGPDEGSNRSDFRSHPNRPWLAFRTGLAPMRTRCPWRALAPPPSAVRLDQVLLCTYISLRANSNGWMNGNGHITWDRNVGAERAEGQAGSNISISPAPKSRRLMSGQHRDDPFSSLAMRLLNRNTGQKTTEHRQRSTEYHSTISLPSLQEGKPRIGCRSVRYRLWSVARWPGSWVPGLALVGELSLVVCR